MKLLNPNLVRAAINEPDLDQVTISTATELATAPLEDLLRTSFRRSTVSDIYHIDPDRDAGVGTFPTKLQLSRGFLDAVAPVTLSVETLVDGAFHVPAEDYTGGYTVNREAGLLTVPARLSGWYTVSYTAGFEVDTECGIVTTDIPDWLASAALTYINVIYHRLNARHATSGVVEKMQDVKGAAITALPDGLILGLRQYIRWYPSAYQVEWSA